LSLEAWGLRLEAWGLGRSPANVHIHALVLDGVVVADGPRRHVVVESGAVELEGEDLPVRG
jgi:hypothetical protein